MPLFLDPGWDVEVRALGEAGTSGTPAARRWDGEDVHAVEGPYGDYLLSRVARVFPDLFDSVAGSSPAPTRRDHPREDTGREGGQRV